LVYLLCAMARALCTGPHTPPTQLAARPAARGKKEAPPTGVDGAGRLDRQRLVLAAVAAARRLEAGGVRRVAVDPAAEPDAVDVGFQIPLLVVAADIDDLGLEAVAGQLDRSK